MNNKFMIKPTYEGREIPIYYVKDSKKIQRYSSKIAV